MSNIGFMKTKKNELTSKFKNRKLSFHILAWKENDLGSLGTVSHVVSFTIHLPTWQKQQSMYFSSCSISALRVLSHF